MTNPTIGYPIQSIRIVFISYMYMCVFMKIFIYWTLHESMMLLPLLSNNLSGFWKVDSFFIWIVRGDVRDSTKSDFVILSVYKLPLSNFKSSQLHNESSYTDRWSLYGFRPLLKSEWKFCFQWTNLWNGQSLLILSAILNSRMHIALNSQTFRHPSVVMEPCHRKFYLQSLVCPMLRQ